MTATYGWSHRTRMGPTECRDADEPVFGIGHVREFGCSKEVAAIGTVAA